MTVVTVEYIQHLIAELAAFDKLDLKDIQFQQCGVDVTVNQAYLEEWKFTGLGNKFFVMNYFGEDE